MENIVETVTNESKKVELTADQLETLQTILNRTLQVAQTSRGGAKCEQGHRTDRTARRLTNPDIWGGIRTNSYKRSKSGQSRHSTRSARFVLSRPKAGHIH